MATPETHHEPAEANPDPVESVIGLVPVVLPAVGAVLMFLLAFIAVYMA